MRPDFKPHVLGGLAVLVFSALLAGMLLWLGMHPVSVTVLTAGIVAGAAVEGTQADDNRKARLRGEPPPHDVSGRDLFNSALPCLLATALIEAAVKLQWLPAPTG